MDKFRDDRTRKTRRPKPPACSRRIRPAAALTVENRRAWERELPKVYLERSGELGAPEVPFAQAWTWCRQQSLAALAYWTVTYTPSPGITADMQPKDRTLVFNQRLAHAVNDLEALDSFN